MAVIAIAEVQGTTDQEKTLTYVEAVTNGPVSVALTGSGLETNGAAVDQFQWVLLESPTGSTAALDTPTSQTCNLTNINLAGSYRVYLIAKVSATAETSTQNILRAPASAFIDISVTTQNYAMHKPSRGQRNWHDEYHHLVDVVDSLKSDIDAAGTAANTDSHRLTCILQGSRVLTEAPQLNSGGSAQTFTGGNFGFLPGLIVAQNVSYESSAHCGFMINDTGKDLTLKNWSVTALANGLTSDASNSSINNTTFQLRVLTKANWESGSGADGTADTSLGTLVGNITVDAFPMATGTPLPISATASISETAAQGEILAVYCTANPDRAPIKGVTVNIQAISV